MDRKIVLKPKEDTTSTFSIRIPRTHLEALERICKQTGHSRNELIKIAIENFLENVEVEKEK